MKKSLCFVLAACLALAVVGCSSSDKGKAASKSGGGVAVDENLLTVDVTLPGSYFEGSSDESITAGAKANGFKNVKVNEDGSVTYTMSKAQHKKLLQELKAGIDKSINDMVNGEEAIESFEEISYDKNMTEFNVKVDKEKYSVFDSMAALVFYFSGTYYQALSGVAPEDNKVIVNFVDSKTGEVIESGDSSKLGEQED